MRASIVAVAALAALAAAGPAAAHPRTAPVALDYRLRLTAPAGVAATALDGERTLRLRAAPGTTVLVRGYLGEPFLRFAANGVWADEASPTAATDKVVRRTGRGWIRVASGRAFAWHDHRLTPPRLTLPLVVDGRAETLTGTFVRVPRPRPWPWLAAGLAALGAAAVIALRAPRRRADVAVAAAVAAACAALAPAAAYAAAGAITQAGDAWGQTAYTAVLAVAAAAALRIRSRALRAWAAVVAGAFAFAFSVRFLGVFWHGVVVSALSPTAVRTAVAVAVAGGIAAVGLGALAAEARR